MADRTSITIVRTAEDGTQSEEVWIVGSGVYEWVDEDGTTYRSGTHWDELPAKMHRIIAFIPSYPRPPHTQDVHDAMATFQDKFDAALARCRC